MDKLSFASAAFVLLVASVVVGQECPVCAIDNDPGIAEVQGKLSEAFQLSMKTPDCAGRTTSSHVVEWKRS